MSQVEITVRGSHTMYVPPERATVRLLVGLEGADAEQVYAAVAQVAGDVRRSIEDLHRPDAGPVTWWSSDQIQTWANRPWNKDGKQLPLVHHARVVFQVKFSDFVALSRWLTSVSGMRGTSVAGVEWALTVAQEEQLTREVRTAAVAEARAKAQAYADALEAGEVRAIALADAGMLGTGSPDGPSAGAAMTRVAHLESAPDVELAPQHVALTAAVDGRFLVG